MCFSGANVVEGILMRDHVEAAADDVVVANVPVADCRQKGDSVSRDSDKIVRKTHAVVDPE